MATSIWPDLLPARQVRIARPTDRLDELVAFYRDGLGQPELERFAGHAGYRGAAARPAQPRSSPRVHPARRGQPRPGPLARPPAGARFRRPGPTAPNRRAAGGSRPPGRGGEPVLFELAEDSASELDSYLHRGLVLVARTRSGSAAEIAGHLQLVDTGRPGEAELLQLSEAAVPATHPAPALARIGASLPQLRQPRRRGPRGVAQGPTVVRCGLPVRANPGRQLGCDGRIQQHRCGIACGVRVIGQPGRVDRIRRDEVRQDTTVHL